MRTSITALIFIQNIEYQNRTDLHNICKKVLGGFQFSSFHFAPEKCQAIVSRSLMFVLRILMREGDYFYALQVALLETKYQRQARNF